MRWPLLSLLFLTAACNDVSGNARWVNVPAAETYVVGTVGQMYVYCDNHGNRVYTNDHGSVFVVPHDCQG